MNRYKFTRKELKNMSIYDFQEGDVIRCGKYRIEVRFVQDHQYLYAYKSEIMDFKTVRILSYSIAPNYIQDFFDRPD